MVFQLVVDGYHLPSHGSKELGHSLHGFNRPERLARRDSAADLRQFDVDDVAKLLLSVIGDADFARLAVDPNPFVVLGVFPVHRIRHGALRADLTPPLHGPLQTWPYIFRL